MNTLVVILQQQRTTYTLGDLIADMEAVLDQTGDAFSARVTRYANDVLQEIADFYPKWNWLRTAGVIVTEAGLSQYALDAGCEDPLPSFVISTEWPLEKKTPEDLTAMLAFSTGQGQPKAWAWSGENQISLAPAPDGEYLITYAYRSRLPRLSATTETPPIPEKFVRLWKQGVEAYLKETDNRFDAATTVGFKRWYENLSRAVFNERRGQRSWIKHPEEIGAEVWG